MTVRELMGELMLQGIKDGDLVVIELENKTPIKGFLTERQLYDPGFLQDKLREAFYGIKNNSRPKLIISVIEDKTEFERKLEESMMINFNLLPLPQMDIYPEQVVGIKKIQ